MQATLGEEQGCAILEEAFRRRGFDCARNVPFDEAGVSCELDGWDAAHRVGFEYLVRSEGDHDDLTPQELDKLAARMERDELAVLVVDAQADAEVLRFAADRFLDEVLRRRGGATSVVAKAARPAQSTGKGGAATSPAKKAPAKKAPAKKAPAKKAAVKKTTTVKKAAVKKTAAKKKAGAAKKAVNKSGARR
jgi:hypothetical protein